jgi:uncharacterized protein YndB with AHSA1/START domain
MVCPTVELPRETERDAEWRGPNGHTLISCEVDFRPGGVSRLCMRSSEGRDYWVEGLSLEIAEPERIVFAGEFEINGPRLTGVPGTITFRRA